MTPRDLVKRRFQLAGVDATTVPYHGGVSHTHYLTVALPLVKPTRASGYRFPVTRHRWNVPASQVMGVLAAVKSDHRARFRARFNQPVPIEELADHLYNARNYQSLTVDAVAERMGVDPRRVREMEQGGYDFTLSELRRYQLAVGLLADWQVTPIKQELASSEPRDTSSFPLSKGMK